VGCHGLHAWRTATRVVAEEGRQTLREVLNPALKCCQHITMLMGCAAPNSGSDQCQMQHRLSFLR
jgi:hypothetical protein